MKRNLLFVFAVFAAIVFLMALQKPAFLVYYAAQAAGGSFTDWCQVVWSGLKLDMAVAGYVTAFSLFVVLLSLWIKLPERAWHIVLNCYFVLVSLFTAAIFAVDIALYEHWGFRLDATILIYLSDPKEAMASVDMWLALRQMLMFGVYAGVMIWICRWVIRLFGGQPLRFAPAMGASVVVLVLAALDFVVVRGGVGTSVSNVSKVYFSPNMFLNHAATNPVFSFLSSLGDPLDYGSTYPFFDEQTRSEKFDALRGNSTKTTATEPVLDTLRPNVVVVLLESFARTVMDASVDGESVMPNMQRLKNEGVWFENFFCSSFRTDRGEVSVLSGFPAQTQLSIMKLPTKSRDLPSLARSLGREGYATSFTYGGDLNFTNQASYMYATGWQNLIWQKDMSFPTPTSDWGYDDAVVCDYFADQVIALNGAGKPFLAGLLTLSSHRPFDVPYHKFEDKVLNAMAFSDECVGRMVEKLKASPAWDNLLLVLVADHGYPYPSDLEYNAPLRHRIPMIWLGGAVSHPRVVTEYASQIDICASVLAQMGVDHSDFDYSKDIFNSETPKFGYYVFNDGFGVVDASGSAVWDNTSSAAIAGTDPRLFDIGRTLLQTTYVDIGRR